MTPFVGSPVEAKRLLAVGFVGDDGRCPALVKPLAQFGAVIGPIAKQLLCRLRALYETLRWRTIVRLPAGQQDGKKTALSIRDCVDFRVAPATRATNCLLMLPLFAPEAERCASMWVLSII